MNTVIRSDADPQTLIERIDHILSRPYMNDLVAYEVEIRAACIHNGYDLDDLPTTAQDWAISLARARANLNRCAAILRMKDDISNVRSA